VKLNFRKENHTWRLLRSIMVSYLFLSLIYKLDHRYICIVKQYYLQFQASPGGPVDKDGLSYSVKTRLSVHRLLSISILNYKLVSPSPSLNEGFCSVSPEKGTLWSRKGLDYDSSLWSLISRGIFSKAFPLPANHWKPSQ
jgi:hypothetical protein